ncbi:MAG: hypothetical protein AAF677_13615 [Pseudomonadota bacterium]
MSSTLVRAALVRTLSAIAVALGLAAPAAANPGLETVVDLGLGGFDRDGMVQRLGPHWHAVERCDELTLEADGQTWVMMGAFADRAGARKPFNLACALEERGHDITHVLTAEATHPTFGRQRTRYFWRIATADGHEVIVDGGIGGSDRNSDPGTVYLFGYNLTIYNARNGRWYTTPRKLEQQTGSDQQEVTAWLLGQGDFDTTKIGIRAFGIDIGMPSDADAARAVRARVAETYPSHRCQLGFRSNLAGFPSVEVCVNFKDVEARDCTGLEGSKNGARCDLVFTVVAGSSTHPQYNDRFLAERTRWTVEGSSLFYRDDAGWVWDTSDDRLHELVPAEFRHRKPFGD